MAETARAILHEVSHSMVALAIVAVVYWGIGKVVLWITSRRTSF
jgi:hypothetical protein